MQQRYAVATLLLIELYCTVEALYNAMFWSIRMDRVIRANPGKKCHWG